MTGFAFGAAVSLGASAVSAADVLLGVGVGAALGRTYVVVKWTGALANVAAMGVDIGEAIVMLNR